MTKQTTTAVVKQPDSSVENFISQAIASNASVETLERLFDLRAKVKAEAAKEAYIKALSVFQAACPVIKKTKKVLNNDGRSVRYTFAPLDSIVEQIKKPLASAELSYRWETKQEASNVTAICFITHILGHTESSDFTVEIDAKAFMNSPQKTASALTFAKRYTLCNALGIATGDEDDDSLSSSKQSDAKSIKAKIALRLRTLEQKTATREDVEAAVKTLTQLELKDENFEEIAARLQTLIDEKQSV